MPHHTLYALMWRLDGYEYRDTGIGPLALICFRIRVSSGE